MNKELYEFKEKLLSTGLFKNVTGSSWRRLRECPFCGDSKWHMYVKIDLTSDDIVGYNCFKCNAHGYVNDKFLKSLNIDLEVPKVAGGTRRINGDGGVSTKVPTVNVNEYDNIDGVCRYINERVGHVPTLGELQAFQYVGNPKKYAMEYLGMDDINNIRNRYWFQMTNGNIIGRYGNDNTEMRWLKYHTNKCKSTGLYKIAVPIDLGLDINVMISEGVMDSIGLYYNYHGCTNNIYLSVMGKDYVKGIKYILNKGIFGKSVNIMIFKDKDVDINKIYIPWTLKKMFKSVSIYENMMAKDFGVCESEYDVCKVIMPKNY
jgi:hypothetical protein